MRYAVSGTRSRLSDLDKVLINHTLGFHGVDETNFIHVGDCKSGVDEFIRKHPQLTIGGVYEADWDTHGKAAGPIRNRTMLASEPSVAFAFPRLGLPNKGTKDFVRACLEREVDVLVTWLLEDSRADGGWL